MFVCFLGATEESFMYLANHYESKNMSVGKECIKRFEFACMTILSPETVSIVLSQCSVMDIQVPPVPNLPKTAEILAQNASKMHIEATINQTISRERSPEPPYERQSVCGGIPSSCVLPPFALTSARPLLKTWRRACD